jgi:hypothetical protein
MRLSQITTPQPPLCEDLDGADTTGLGEHKFWIGPGGEAIRCDNHDIWAEDYFGDGRSDRDDGGFLSDYDDEDEDDDDDGYATEQGDYRDTAFEEGYIRVNIARYREYANEFNIEGKGTATVHALEALIAAVRYTPDIDIYEIDFEGAPFGDIRVQTQHTRQAITCLNRLLRQKKAAG